MPSCNSCEKSIPVKSKCKPCVKCKPCPPPKQPECRGKSVKDKCRVKTCPPCRCICPPPPCVRKTKCKVPSVKDKCRSYKPCPEPIECCPICPDKCKCVPCTNTFNQPCW